MDEGAERHGKFTAQARGEGRGLACVFESLWVRTWREIKTLVERKPPRSTCHLRHPYAIQYQPTLPISQNHLLHPDLLRVTRHACAIGSGALADGAQRFSSSPQPGQQQPQHYAPAHVPAYTSPFQHQQQQHPPNGPHLHQQQHSIPQPQQFGAWGMNDATAQFGMQLGQSAVAAGQEYVQRTWGGVFPNARVKPHFNVSNSYVLHKLRILLFPWTHKHWGRKSHRTETGQTEWLAPREDVNSPDLYIPLMALVTYILLCALDSGVHARFHPQVLGESATRAIMVVILDFLFLQLGCYFLNVQSTSQSIDVIAYGGYKFVGVIIIILAGFLQIGGVLGWIAYVYFITANAFFLMRSLRSLILPDAASRAASADPYATAPSAPQRRRRIAFLLVEAASQVVWMGFLAKL
ncbi:WD-REPEATS-REGION domain-containing protein [Mycena kentingensis (nom. inval.)]|nr:WD-REPEATS-REGION domain-containing protein [Mycena kentingensis (nom. inval.)]